MAGEINVGGTWHTSNGVQINIAGVWHKASQAFINIAGTWHTWFQSKITDSFARTTSGTLGNTDTGQTWSALIGAWFSNSGYAETTSTSSGYALAVVPWNANATVTAEEVQDGMGLAFWETDSGDWWAVATGTGSYSYQSCISYGCNGYGCLSSGCCSSGCCSSGCNAGYYCLSYSCNSYGCLATGCTNYSCSSTSCNGYGCTSYGCTGTGCTSHGCTGSGCTGYSRYGCSSHGCTGTGCTGTGCTGTGCTGAGCTGYSCTGYSCSSYGCTTYGCTNLSCTGGYACAGTGCISSGCCSAGCCSSGCTSYGCNAYSPVIYVWNLNLIQSVASVISSIATWAFTTTSAYTPQVNSLEVQTSGTTITITPYSDSYLSVPYGTETWVAGSAPTGTVGVGIIETPAGSLTVQGDAIGPFTAQ